VPPHKSNPHDRTFIVKDYGTDVNNEKPDMIDMGRTSCGYEKIFKGKAKDFKIRTNKEYRNLDLELTMNLDKLLKSF